MDACRLRSLRTVVPLLLSLALVLGVSPFTARSAAAGVSSGVVEIDMRIENIYGFSARDKTFNAEGTLWTIGSSGSVASGAAMPFEFANIIQPWNSRIEPLLAEPRSLPGERLLQGYAFKGTFYSNQIDFKSFPFGGFSLGVLVRPRQGSMLELRPGRGEIGDWTGLNGYHLQRWSFGRQIGRSGSRVGRGMAEFREQLTFNLIYRTSIWTPVMRWLLPLGLVMVLMLLAPNISCEMTSERLAIPPVVMLTVVFLQQSYREFLPNLNYLTAMDWLYALSTIVTVVFFVHFIRAANLVRAVHEEGRKALVRRLDRLDLWLQMASLMAYGMVLIGALRLN